MMITTKTFKGEEVFNLMSQIIAGYIKKTYFLSHVQISRFLHNIFWNRFPINQKIVNHFVWLKKCDFKLSESKSFKFKLKSREVFFKKHIFGWRSELVLYFEGYNYSNVHLYNYTFVTNSKLQIWCCGLGDKYTWFGCGLWLNKYLTMMIWVMK